MNSPLLPPPLFSGFSSTGPWSEILPKHLLTPHLNPSSFQSGSDAFWMLQAWMESLRYHGLTAPHPAVGCVLVDSSGNEISRGSTQAYPGSHAEKIAMERVPNLAALSGATAYVTLEPCAHQGKNPPCVELFLQSPIRRVVIAREDPNPLVGGRGIQKLRDAGKEVCLGTLSTEVSSSNLAFLTQQILGRPLIALKWAQTLDGQLADDSDHSQWISSPTSRVYAHWLRQHYDLIVVGMKTVLKDLPKLTARDVPHPHQGNPLPVLLDPKGLIFELPKKNQKEITQTLFQWDRPTLLITSKKALESSEKSWTRSVPQLHILGQPGKKWIPEVMQILRGPEIESLLGRPLQSILVEGGAQTLAQFLISGYGDIFHCFVAPILTGGMHHRIGVKSLLSGANRLHTLSTSQLESDLLMELITQEIKNSIFTLTPEKN